MRSHHSFSCCCPSCLGPDTKECERCGKSIPAGGEDYCAACLTKMHPRAKHWDDDASSAPGTSPGPTNAESQ